MLEKVIQNEILGYLLGEGYFVWRQNSGTVYVQGRRIKMGEYGQPDIVGMTKDGRWLGIEVKSAKGKQTTYQKMFEQSAKANNGLYILAHSLEEVKDLL